MEAINIITDANGVQTGIFLDLEMIKKTCTSDTDMECLIEDVEDTLALLLHKNEEYSDWEEVKKRLNLTNETRE